MWNLRVDATPGKFVYFYSYLKSEKVFPALNLTQNCYVNMKLSFSWKLLCQSQIVSFSLVLVQTYRGWKTILTICLSQLVSELRTIWKYNRGLYWKKKSIFFSRIEKNWEFQPEQHSKNAISIYKLGKTWKYSVRLTL